MVARKVADWSQLPLGEAPDNDIAIQYGLRASTVSAARRRLSIPPFHKSKGSSSTTKGIDWDEVPLGRAPDAYFAKQYGVSRSVVSNARSRRGILGYSGRSLEERGALLAKDMVKWIDAVGRENVPPPVIEFMRWHGFLEVE